MPTRKDIFINNEIYHVFNKTIDHRSLFIDKKISKLFLDIVRYYRSTKANIRYSYFRKLSSAFRDFKEREINCRKYFKIEILAYCIMPNHFHLLLKQTIDKGIIRFMADILNSLTRFYNLRTDRKGPIFLTQFKSKRIVSREQLLHVSRYIHLNPYSSGLVNSISELMNYRCSSFIEYINKKNKNNLCETDVILSNFFLRKEKYRKFVLDNAEHQKSLEYIKHAQKW